MDAFKYTAEEIAAMKILLPAFERLEAELNVREDWSNAERYWDTCNDMRIEIAEHEQLVEDEKAETR